MKMKFEKVLCLSIVLLVPELALAKLPFSNDFLGKVEATLDFCTQVDSIRAEKYQEKKKLIVKGLPEKEVAEVRESEEYKAAYQTTTEEAAKGPKEDAVKSCSAALVSKN